MKRRKPRSEAIDWTKSWEIGWWRRQFRSLKVDPAFHAVVTLARLGNMIRFVQGVVVSLPDADSRPGMASRVKPERRRQMMNAFYLSGALLVEAESTVNSAGKHFRNHQEYRHLSKTVHGDGFREVANRFRKLRKWSAFHFDAQGAAEGLARRNEDFVRFMSGRGKLNKDIYFDLADIVALEVVVGEFASKTEFETWFKEWLGRSAAATNALMSAIDEFVVSVVAERGAVERQLTEPNA